MNLKPILVNLLLFTFIFGTTISIYAKDNSKTIEADAQKSSLEWIGKKVLGQHSGNVNLKSGTLFVKGSVLTGGNFVIDMTSISCTDINDAAYNANLIKHLKSTDFFNVDEFTTATLKITKVLKFVNKSDSYNLTADLTVKGITKSISFPATFSKQGNVFEANANITIDRTLWDIKYKSSSFFEGLGDKAIKNEVNLNVKIVSK